jgi:protein-S-isoprenylcysteine O-methyltransferase Ste14
VATPGPESAGGRGSRLPALGPRGEGWVAIQVVLLVVVVAAGPAGPMVAGPIVTPVLAVAGALAIVAGTALAVRGLAELRGALTPLPHPRRGAQLVDTGSYKLVRHPIYGGLVLAAAGYGLLLGSPLAVAAAGLLLAFFRLKSGREEAWLRERYPGYAAYAARTKRILPFVY